MHAYTLPSRSALYNPSKTQKTYFTGKVTKPNPIERQSGPIVLTPDLRETLSKLPSLHGFPETIQQLSTAPDALTFTKRVLIMKRLINKRDRLLQAYTIDKPYKGQPARYVLWGSYIIADEKRPIGTHMIQDCIGIVIHNPQTHQKLVGHILPGTPPEDLEPALTKIGLSSTSSVKLIVGEGIYSHDTMVQTLDVIQKQCPDFQQFKIYTTQQSKHSTAFETLTRWATSKQPNLLYRQIGVENEKGAFAEVSFRLLETLEQSGFISAEGALYQYHRDRIVPPGSILSPETAQGYCAFQQQFD